MFLRSSVVKKSGKTYRYWKLVENVRTDAGPRQQVVAHLGDLSNFTATDWQALAGRMGEPEMAAALERRVRQGGRQGPSPMWDPFPIPPQPPGRPSPDEWASRKWPPLSNAGSGRAVAKGRPPKWT